MRKLKNINLDDLVEKGIIEENTAEKILAFYRSQQEDAPNRLSIVFGVLGATLVGLGIMLIVAHNWDNLSRGSKTVLAFLPMILGQAACAFTLFKKKNNVGWRESSATFLFFAVGACIALVSQVYHLEGELGSFLLTWMLLCLPLVYVMQSSIVSLLYIGGITWYAANCGYSQNHEPYLFWALLTGSLPHYYQLYKNSPTGNAFNYHSWAIAISVLISLGLWSLDAPVLMWIAYVSLLALYFLIGSQSFFRNKRTANNPFLLIGILGTIGLFLVFTFGDYWKSILREKMDWSTVLVSQEFWVSALLIASSLYLFLKLKPIKNFDKISPLPFGFLIFLIVFTLGYKSPVTGMVLSNLFILATGIFYIFRGNQLNDLGVLNLGLLTLTALIICRFFDLDLSFVVRGVLFVLVGIGFFVANYQVIERRKVQ